MLQSPPKAKFATNCSSTNLKVRLHLQNRRLTITCLQGGSTVPRVLHTWQLADLR